MAEHKTLIGSAAGEIEGGTVLLNGVACEIELGMTLAGGVAQEIPFGNKATTVTTSGTFSAGNAYVTVNGTKIEKAQTGEYKKPVTINAYAKTTGGYSSKSIIVLNGKTVASGSGYTAAEFEFETEADLVTITSERNVITGGSGNYYYTITITEE